MLAAMGKNILLATTVDWPSAAYLARAFASLGCWVEAVYPRGHVLGLSRYLGAAHAYRPLNPRASLAAAIAAAEPDLIVPCDDRAVTHLLSLQAQFAPLLIRSLGRLDSYPLMMERSRAMAIAEEEGIAVPLSFAVADEDEFRRALEQVGLPAVLKADGSWGGDGVAVVRTREEAERAFRKLASAPSRLRSAARAFLRKDAHFLHEALVPKKPALQLQRFIAGKPATSAFACRDGEVLAAIHVDVVETLKATGPASLIKRVDCARMDEAARRIARRFGLSGLHGLDFVRDETGVPHLIEINPRATQICHLALGAGRDLVTALLGLPPRAPATARSLIALFPQAWQPGRPLPSEAYLDAPRDDPAVLAIFQSLTQCPPSEEANARRPRVEKVYGSFQR